MERNLSKIRREVVYEIKFHLDEHTDGWNYTSRIDERMDENEARKMEISGVRLEMDNWQRASPGYKL